MYQAIYYDFKEHTYIKQVGTNSNTNLHFGSELMNGKKMLNQF